MLRSLVGSEMCIRDRRHVGYSVDSKSFRVYNSSTRSARESRNVIFIETPSVLPEPDFVSVFHEGEFTYDDHDDMVQDVRNYTSKLDLSSTAAADRAVEDLSVRDLLEQIRETADRDLDFNPASSEPSGDPPVGSPSDTSPGGESPSGSGGGSYSHGSSGRGSRGGSCLLYTSPSPRDS